MNILAPQLPMQLLVQDFTRRHGLSTFTAANAQDHLEDFALIAAEYEHIRNVMAFNDERTRLLDRLLGRARSLAGKEVGRIAEQFFRDVAFGVPGYQGHRVVGLALAVLQPQRAHIDLAIEGIQNPASQFEQFYALQLATKIFDLIDTTAQKQLCRSVHGQLNQSITVEAEARWNMAEALLERGAEVEQTMSDTAASVPPMDEPEMDRSARVLPLLMAVGKEFVAINHCASGSRQLRFTDVAESHGDFLVSRAVHTLRVPSVFRIARYLITNSIFQLFVQDGAYRNDALWEPGNDLRRYLSKEDQLAGPAGWFSASQPLSEVSSEPVSGISVLEAEAFVRWLNLKWRPSDGWYWCLPSEDIWELAARGDEGLTYPWGDAFQSDKCNSQETGLGRVSDVRRFEAGQSPYGCVDMAGNLWEFMQRPRTGGSYDCILRGGSYRNTSTEVRSYLRLTDVPVFHRALDFGMRLAQGFGTVPDFYMTGVKGRLAKSDSRGAR